MKKKERGVETDKNDQTVKPGRVDPRRGLPNYGKDHFCHVLTCRTCRPGSSQRQFLPDEFSG